MLMSLIRENSLEKVEIYAKGLTRQEYYRNWEEEHRETRNTYRRDKYREKCREKIRNESVCSSSTTRRI